MIFHEKSQKIFSKSRGKNSIFKSIQFNLIIGY